MNRLRVVKYLIAFIPMIIGIAWLIVDLKKMKAHPEWSASPGVAWIKFLILSIVTLVLVIYFYKSNK